MPRTVVAWHARFAASHEVHAEAELAVLLTLDAQANGPLECLTYFTAQISTGGMSCMKPCDAPTRWLVRAAHCPWLLRPGPPRKVRPRCVQGTAVAQPQVASQLLKAQKR